MSDPARWCHAGTWLKGWMRFRLIDRAAHQRPERSRAFMAASAADMKHDPALNFLQSQHGCVLLESRPDAAWMGLPYQPWPVPLQGGQPDVPGDASGPVLKPDRPDCLIHRRLLGGPLPQRQTLSAPNTDNGHHDCLIHRPLLGGPLPQLQTLSALHADNSHHDHLIHWPPLGGQQTPLPQLRIPSGPSTDRYAALNLTQMPSA
jgi:hypothetical protein